MVDWISNHIELILEIAAVIFGIIYVILAAKSRVSCWIYGIIGSLLSVYLFFVYAKLYAEAALYVFYVVAGIYGWVKWQKHDCPEECYQQKLSTHVKYIGIGTVLSVLLYYIINYLFEEAEKPLIDSFTTIFSF
ncbi:MAG: nicotinamide riboside transporter PnuC, partial [Vicingaceae bacterium]|nr:nicotinamide riboside transporter PnuC [Vicingaceae bacterium]